MKKTIALIFTLFLIIGLAACSNSNNEDNKKKEQTTDKDEMRVAELMQQDKTHIWFVVPEIKTGELEEDTAINRFLVTKNGKMKVYVAKEVPEQTMSKMLKLDNKELLKNIKEQDKDNYETTKNFAIGDTKTEIEETERYMKEGKEEYRPKMGYGYALTREEVDNKQPEDILQKLKDYKGKLENAEYKEPKSQNVNLGYSSDSEETISIAREYNFPKTIAHGDNTDNDLEALSFNNPFQPIEISDSNIAGLSYSDGNEDEENNDQSPYLVTKVGDEIKDVTLDDPEHPAVKENSSETE
ncbi:hypothetical protein M4L90_12455 [Staphylococcus equorum]|uniref:Lipoprotein n=1 Tax=Staphylococcus equorum TaxID=246432 RepID=A0A9X4LBT0_9STAP|nr:hypothetical protein [Staphylococcus equorum]MDG0820732.1 hypothetical protein [Staphylococcus equorum]MDG0841357.1 hypothetical protein [Staphylococcus equorum]MDG0847057.1 hypothetical protein [Staphylococcus equorum]PTE82333.1 hypothetical protein BUY85_00925 [Staphylococcus equorum]